MHVTTLLRRVLSVTFSLVLLATLFFTAAAPAALADSSHITIGNSNLYSQVGSNTVTLTTPTGAASGHFMVAAIKALTEGTSVTTVPTGWTLLRESRVDGTDHVWTYYKYLSSAPLTSYAWVLSAYTNVAGIIQDFTGVDPTIPFGYDSTAGGSGTISQGASAGDIDLTTTPLPALRASVGGSCRIAIYAAHYAGLSNSFSAPSGWTAGANNIADLYNSLAMAYKDKVNTYCDSPANNLAPGVATWGHTTSGSTGVHLILRPAGAPYIGSNSTTSGSTPNQTSVALQQATGYRFVADGGTATTGVVNQINIYLTGSASAAHATVMGDSPTGGTGSEPTPDGTEKNGECSLPAVTAAGWNSCKFSSSATLTTGAFYWLVFLDTVDAYPINDASHTSVDCRERRMVLQSSIPTGASSWSTASCATGEGAAFFLDKFIVTTTVYSDPTLSTNRPRALSLWNGSSNNAVPTNWYGTGFDDSASPWVNAASSSAPDATTISGATRIWPEANASAYTEKALTRQKFSVPSGTINSGSMTVECDNYCDAVYLNGVSQGACTNGVPGTTNSKCTYTITSSLVTGDNVLAVEGENADTTGTAAAWIAYSISVTTQ